ncbi:hypothetical protein MHZ93_08040 [Roseomonas sp. ACRSG]|nr:hypothetical protein [Roseomonas sp. ACRSG]
MTMSSTSGRIRVNRAPVLTLWAAVVAERLGHPPDTALSLASYVAGTAARAKARRLGLAEDAEHRDDTTSLKPREAIRLLGKEVPLAHDADGEVLADAGGGKPAPAAPIKAYVSRAFGQHLPAVRAAMEELAARHDPEELNRIGFRLYERFRPEVPADVTGWGARGELNLEAIRQAGS